MKMDQLQLSYDGNDNNGDYLFNSPAGTLHQFLINLKERKNIKSSIYNSRLL